MTSVLLRRRQLGPRGKMAVPPPHTHTHRRQRPSTSRDLAQAKLGQALPATSSGKEESCPADSLQTSGLHAVLSHLVCATLGQQLQETHTPG